MTPPATTTAWAIKAPDGTILDWTIRFRSNQGAVDAYMEVFGKRSWLKRVGEGYRCVRVRIEEVAE